MLKIWQPEFIYNALIIPLELGGVDLEITATLSPPAETILEYAVVYKSIKTLKFGFLSSLSIKL